MVRFGKCHGWKRTRFDAGKADQVVADLQYKKKRKENMCERKDCVVRADKRNTFAMKQRRRLLILQSSEDNVVANTRELVCMF